MQTLTITFSIPDGVQFQVNAVPSVPEGVTYEVKPNGSAEVVKQSVVPTVEDLKRAFMESVLREQKTKPGLTGPASITGTMAALGKPTLKDVEPAEFAAAIERLSGVAK